MGHSRVAYEVHNFTHRGMTYGNISRHRTPAVRLGALAPTRPNTSM